MEQESVTKQPGSTGQQIQRNQQGVTGQQSANTTAHYQLNSIYDTNRADDIKDVLPEYRKNRHDARNIDLSRGVKYGGVADAESQAAPGQKSSPENYEENIEFDTRQSKVNINKDGIQMQPNGAGKCKVLKKECLVSILLRTREGRWKLTRCVASQ